MPTRSPDNPGAPSLSPLTADEVVACITSHMRIFVHGACATPSELLEAMTRRTDLHHVELYHLHLNGPAPFAAPAMARRFRSHSLFTGSNVRTAIAEGRADFVPIFLSDIPWLFKSRKVDLDVALLQLSPPDSHGFCSLGTSVDAARAACDHARIVLAVINQRMPRTHGDSFVHISRIHRFIEVDRPLLSSPRREPDEVELRVGSQVANLIKAGATLQLGIGAIADAVARQLRHQHDLGLHTEMFSDAAVELITAGVINNRRKQPHRGKSITSFVNGSEALFALIDDNPAFEFYPCDVTNDPATIRQHADMVAINGAIELDLTGQVCADSLGHTIYSGIGGQMDFLRGAALAVGGMPIVALPSTARQGTVSRIVASLAPGAGVVTTRGHVHWVVTEHGAVNLHGLSLRQRAAALISIAHPDFRGELRAAVSALRHF
jgi:4-hydroxybutyrate CoA-transferase